MERLIIVSITGASQIYKTLGTIGLKKGQVKALLPDWWEDSVAATETGTWELVTLLSRRLSIDAAGLIEGRLLPIGSASRMAYKHRADMPVDSYKASSLIGGALAHAVLFAMPQPLALPSMNPAVIRETIRGDCNGLVDFDGVLRFCWASGIPVIPLPHLPLGVRKMDGAALLMDTRPAIIISRKNDSRAWLSFILAHELGHYCCGHLDNDSAIIDVSLKTDATSQSEASGDLQEREADAFALALLGGPTAATAVDAWNPRASGVELAVNARGAAPALGVAAGHLVLRHAFRTKRWAEAHTALQFLDEDFDAQSALTSALQTSIDMNRLADDMQELVASVTGIARV